jgi:hypothetical protein
MIPYTTSLLLCIILACLSAPAPPVIQRNAISSAGDNSRINMNEQVIEQSTKSVLGFGKRKDIHQENVVKNIGDGHIQLNGNFAEQTNADKKLFGNILTSGRSTHSQLNEASTVNGNIQVNGNSEISTQSSGSLFGNGLSLGRQKKTAEQKNSIQITGVGDGQMNHNTFMSTQTDNDFLGIIYISLIIGGTGFLGGKKSAKQINSVVALNGKGQANDNHAVVKQTDKSLFGSSTPIPGVPGLLGLSTKEAIQVNEVRAEEGTVNFNTLDVTQQDSSLIGGLFNKQVARQDNILCMYYAFLTTLRGQW